MENSHSDFPCESPEHIVCQASRRTAWMAAAIDPTVPLALEPV